MKNKKTKKQKIIITAGPTREPLDPVRYISNSSSGTMGYSIARALRDKGYEIVLISGPVERLLPKNIKVINVKTAGEMKSAVQKNLKQASCIIASAAVSDFRLKKFRKQKIKKKESLILELVKNPDILKSIKKKNNILKIGFALETSNLEKNAVKKLKEKELDIIVANKISKKQNPFGADLDKNGREIKRRYSMISADETIKVFNDVTKHKMARTIATEVAKRLKTNEK